MLHFYNDGASALPRTGLAGTRPERPVKGSELTSLVQLSISDRF